MVENKEVQEEVKAGEEEANAVIIDSFLSKNVLIRKIEVEVSDEEKRVQLQVLASAEVEGKIVLTSFLTQEQFETAIKLIVKNYLE